METEPSPKPVVWIASSKRDLKALPEVVQRSIGFALWRAQLGKRHAHAKVLKGFGSAGVLEVVEDYDGDTYRAVYTVRFAEAVYVVHVFQKKSHSRGKTPRADRALIEKRLRDADEFHKQRSREKK